MFYLVGIIISFFLAIILAAKKGKTGADRILVLWLIASGIHLVFYYLLYTGENRSFPMLLGLELPLPLVHGPFLYLYTRSVTRQGKIGMSSLLHFLPILASYFLFLRYFFFTAEEKIMVYQEQGKGFESELRINTTMIIISGIAYIILSLRALNRHKRIIQNRFSYTEKVSLAWLQYLTIGMAMIWTSVIFINSTTTFALVVLFVMFIGYFGIKQVGIFTQHVPPGAGGDANQAPTEALAQEPTGDLQKEKYQKSGLNEQEGRKIQASLSKAMQEKKLYVNPELTLAELAEALDTNPNNLSQVINTLENKSFYDYVNLMRIEEFKRIAALPDSQRFTLLALAQECGFNSKTTFNRNFKTATGLSPSEYLKQAHINLV